MLPRLAALAILRAADGKPASGKNVRRARMTAPAQTADVIDQLRSDDISLIYDPAAKTLRTDAQAPAAVGIG